MKPAQATTSPLDSAFEVTTAHAWRESVGALIAGNSRLMFAASCALAAPLLSVIGMESIGFHMWGRSGCGKTLALRVANSVAGGPPLPMHMASSTYANSRMLERKQFVVGMAGDSITAAAHCDRVLAVDDAGSEVLPQFAFLLSGNAPAAPSLSWRLLLLSAGQGASFGDVERMAMLPMDAGAGMGGLSFLHGMESAADLARAIEQGATAHGTGAVARLFTNWAQAQSSPLVRRIREGASFLATSFVTEAGSATQRACNGFELDGGGDRVGRMAGRFALVGMAGAMATEAGLTGWAYGDSEAAAKACFDAWLKSSPSGARA